MLKLTKNIIFILATLIIQTSYAARACNTSEINEVLETTSNGVRKSITIGCNLTLPKGSIVTKKIVVESSDIEINCNGSSIDARKGEFGGEIIAIKSKKIGSNYKAPKNVTIQNCNIFGGVRIYGIGRNGEDTNIRELSKSRIYIQKVREAAPSHITFKNNTINGIGTGSLYLSPGTTYITVSDNIFKGQISGTVIYLGAETAYNTIRNNNFNMKSEGREVIAVDSSAHNKIENNRFSGLNHGGVYLYRNCGEGGTIRHQTPSYNVITKNTFYYKNYNGSNPSVWLSSRDGGRNYCDDDSYSNKYKFGSSLSNKDFAQHNYIFDNTIYKFSQSKMIRNKGETNYVYGNKTK